MTLQRTPPVGPDADRSLAATVIVPTTGDRGPLLRHSVGSVLRQSVRDLEVFVVGDGVSPATRDHIEALCCGDERVRFFDFPKHESRGEPNRHQVLSEHARGRIVAYLCDRDLWLPDHLRHLGGVLEDADFAHTLRFRVAEDDQIKFSHVADIRTPGGRAPNRPGPGLIPLSFAGHTLEAYQRLPWGWRATPVGRSTDNYMWAQFLAEPWVRVACSPMPTVLTFKRGDHPGWSTEQRLEILERWSPRLSSAEGVDAICGLVLDALWSDWSQCRQALLVAEANRPAVRARAAAKRARRLSARVWRKAHTVTRR